ETRVYADYVTKYPQAQTAPKHGMGKSMMKRGAIPTPKKKKDAAPKCSRSITVEDNVLSDLDEACEHAGIMLERQVNNEGYEHLKVKLKTKKQPSPEAMLLLNLKKQGKESKKQAILKEIKRKDTREGSGAAPTPYHSSSSNGFFESATNHEKIENERESDHDESDNDYEHGNESDKSTSNEVIPEYVESDNDSDNANDQTEQLMIKPLNKEPEQPPKSLPTPSPIHANVFNEVRNQLPKLLSKVVFDALKKTTVNLSQPTPTPSVDPLKYELKYHLYEKMLQTATYLKHPKHRALKDQEEPTYFERGNDVDEPRQDDEQVHEGPKFQAKEIPEEPEEHEYKDGSVTSFEKLVKKIFKKDKITKEDVDGPSFELLKETCKNNIKLIYNMDQCSLALTDMIDWINPEGDRFHHDLSKPLPLTRPLGKDICSLSVTKIKGEDEGIEEMIPSLWSTSMKELVI
nr:hypothetical protein [Tanacetum cinerariifolium]